MGIIIEDNMSISINDKMTNNIEDKKSSNNEDKIEIFPCGLINFSRITQKVKKKYYNKYSNLYNVCYINSTIQCLFRLDEFVKNILKCDKGNLTIATQSLIYKMQNIDKIKDYCSVSEIKYAMGEYEEIYKNDNQEDVNVFISDYLNYLIEETKYSKINGKINWFCLEKDKEYFNKFYNNYIKRKGNSFILDLFYGITRREEKCKKCNYTFSVKFNPFNMLELLIDEEENNEQYKESIDMRDLIRNYISEKVNEEEICYKCKINTVIKTTINSLPKCLIIFFNRDYSKNKHNKIEIQKTINFEKFVYNKSLIKDNNFFYHLKGIIYYSNFSDKSGHYKSACLVNNEKWYYFDDRKCEIDRGLLKINETENPVFLFYEK